MVTKGSIDSAEDPQQEKLRQEIEEVYRNLEMIMRTEDLKPEERLQLEEEIRKYKQEQEATFRTTSNYKQGDNSPHKDEVLPGQIPTIEEEEVEHSQPEDHLGNETENEVIRDHLDGLQGIGAEDAQQQQ